MPPRLPRRNAAGGFERVSALPAFGPKIEWETLLGTGWQLSVYPSQREVYSLQSPLVGSAIVSCRPQNLVRRVFRPFMVPSIRYKIHRAGADFLTRPSAICAAPRLDGGGPRSKSNLGSHLQDALTIPASLTGLPTLNIPMEL